jgi:hypothetical protein
MMQPGRANVGAAMIAHGAEHSWLQLSKGHVVGERADVQFGVVITVRIAAIDEHVVSTVSSHVGEPHGLIVKHQIRDRPGPYQLLNRRASKSSCSLGLSSTGLKKRSQRRETLRQVKCCHTVREGACTVPERATRRTGSRRNPGVRRGRISGRWRIAISGLEPPPPSNHFSLGVVHSVVRGVFFLITGLGMRLDSRGRTPAQSGNGLLGWELWKRVGQHKAKAQDTFPYLASAPPLRWGIFLRLADRHRPASLCTDCNVNLLHIPARDNSVPSLDR